MDELLTPAARNIASEPKYLCHDNCKEVISGVSRGRFVASTVAFPAVIAAARGTRPCLMKFAELQRITITPNDRSTARPFEFGTSKLLTWLWISFTRIAISLS